MWARWWKHLSYKQEITGVSTQTSHWFTNKNMIINAKIYALKLAIIHARNWNKAFKCKSRWYCQQWNDRARKFIQKKTEIKVDEYIPYGWPAFAVAYVLGLPLESAFNWLDELTLKYANEAGRLTYYNILIDKNRESVINLWQSILDKNLEIWNVYN